MGLFQDVAELLCRRRQLRCPRGHQDWRHAPLASDGNNLTMRHTCGDCGFTTTTAVPVEEARQAWREVLGDRPAPQR
jgi:hypothetical protein